MDKKIIIGAVFAVAIIAVAAIALSGNDKDDSNNSGSAPVGYFDYSMSTKTSFIASGGGTITPSTGNVFVVAYISLKNVSYASGIIESVNNFALMYGAVKYTWSVSYVFYPGHADSNMKYMPGGQGSAYYVFEVPSSIVLSNAKIVWDWYPSNVAYDPSQFA